MRFFFLLTFAAAIPAIISGGIAERAKFTAGGALVYGAIRAVVGLRLEQEEAFAGADLSIHSISATPERETVA